MDGKRILIVDDQRFALQLLRDALAPTGCTIDEAYDGGMAFDKALEFQPDIILMDILMPGVNGIEACKRLKGDERTRYIPIVMITAKKDKEHLVAAFEAGADDYLTKPFAHFELLIRINSTLHRSSIQSVIERKARDSAVLLEISQAITSTLNTREILQIIVDRIAEIIEVKRCSIARVHEADGCGHVLASSDAPDVSGLRIDLERYPEIREVIRTGKSLLIEDAKNHPLMENVREHIVKLDFNTILVLPVIHRCEVIGTLMLRTARGDKPFNDREIRFCQLVANVSAGALRNAFLYERVREESVELHQANAHLMNQDRMKSELINSATHDIRVPVTVIHGYCTLARELGVENLTEKQREYLDAAVYASERLMALIDDMLDLAKLEAGKLELNIAANDIMDPIQEVYAVFAPFAAQKGLALEVEPDEAEIKAFFDHEKIQRVLSNLVGNAIKFTPSGGKIGISVYENEEHVYVSVTDNGEGIPQSHHPKIFEEFYQLESGRRKKGTGLGLAICKRIVSAHRGKIWVDSAPQQGSRFTFSLPAAHS